MISFHFRIGILLIAAVQMTEVLAAQTSPKKTADEMNAAYEAHKADFDYLLGDWEFTTISKTYGKGRGYWSALRLATGQILDEFRIVGDNDETYYVTTTLRAYNATKDRWELVGMNSGGGLQDVGTGHRVGAEVHIEQNFGVAAQDLSTLRIRYFNIQPERFPGRRIARVTAGRRGSPMPNRLRRDESVRRVHCLYSQKQNKRANRNQFGATVSANLRILSWYMAEPAERTAPQSFQCCLQPAHSA